MTADNQKKEKSEMAEVYEALINGSEIDTIDPLVSVTITNNLRSYTYTPEELQLLVIRKKEAA